MSTFIKFDPSDTTPLDEHKLNPDSIREIFLGPEDSPAPRLMSGPKWANDFIAREYRASQITFRGISENVMRIKDPVTSEWVPHRYTFVPYQHRFRLSIFKVFGDLDSLFILVFAGATGRVTHMFMPRMDLAIYDLDAGGAQYSIDIFNNLAKSHTDRLANPIPIAGRVGVVDMLSNYAHQLMNYLSGIQRVIDSGGVAMLDEIWISGTEFFGLTQDIFPELAAKIKHKVWSDIPSELERRSLEAFKLNSNVFTQSLQQRILKLAPDFTLPTVRARHKSPIVWITVRSHDRRCMNLAEIIGRITEALLTDYPNLGVILDGFVFPEGSIVAQSNVVTSLTGPSQDMVRSEAELCLQIAAKIPQDMIVANLVGSSMLQSLGALQYADAYFAHIGTLQHKIAWFTEIRGVVHGPRSELSRLETGPFSSQVGYPPVLMDKESVTDMIADPNTSARFNDYTINDITGIVQSLGSMIESRRPL